MSMKAAMFSLSLVRRCVFYIKHFRKMSTDSEKFCTCSLMRTELEKPATTHSVSMATASRAGFESAVPQIGRAAWM